MNKLGKISANCSECNELIELKRSWITRIFDHELLFDIKLHNHYKYKHNYPYYTLKGIAKTYIGLIFLLLIKICLMPMYLITYPIWWMHEEMFN